MQEFFASGIGIIFHDRKVHTMATKYKVGDTVVFNGYKEEVPEEDQVLEVGDTYEVVEVNTAEKLIALQIENPDFNPKKKETEANAKTVMVDVFFDEVSPHVEDDDAEEEEEEKPAPKAKAKAPAKAKAKAVVEEDEADEDDADEDEADEEDAPAPKAKATAKAKAPAKAETKTPAKGRAKPAAKTTAKAATKGKAPAKGKTIPKAKEAPKEEEDKYPALAKEDDDIVTLIEESEDILELAEELVADSAQLDYRLGGVLYHIRLTHAYHQLDDKYKEAGGFGLYVKEQLNVEYRKAMYLIDIYYKFNLFGIDAEKVQELGWTKASKIAAVMDDENAEELVELAEKSSVADLSDSIKESYAIKGATAGEKVRRITFKFRLVEDHAAFVQEVVETVVKDMKFKDIGEAFEHIVSEWAAEHMNLKARAPKGKTTSKGTAKGRAKAKEEEADEEEVEA